MELLEVSEVLDVPGMIRFVLLCMLEAVEGRLCLLEAPEAMRGVLLCSLEVLEVPEVMRCATLLAGGEARCATLFVRGCGRYALFMDMLEVSDVSDVLDVPEVMRSVLLCLSEVMRGVLLCSLEVLTCWRWRR